MSTTRDDDCMRQVFLTEEEVLLTTTGASMKDRGSTVLGMEKGCVYSIV
jgi:hypothetical protein